MMMLAILAEDVSDAESLVVLVRRLAGRPGLPIRAHRGICGCGDLKNRGSRIVVNYVKQGIDRFIICHDSDGAKPATIRQQVHDAVIQRAPRSASCCVVVPVEEIESWVAADEEAVRQTIPKFPFKGHPAPETIPSPKEWLKRLSRDCGGRPLYAPAVHNKRVLERASLTLLKDKCESFRVLSTAIGKWYPPAEGNLSAY